MRPCYPAYADGTLTIAVETEVFRLENLIRGRVVQDGLGVNTGLVSESALPMILAEKNMAQQRSGLSRTNPVIGLLNGTLICTASVSCFATLKESKRWEHTGVGHEVFEILELAEFVLAGHVITVGDNHPL